MGIAFRLCYYCHWHVFDIPDSPGAKRCADRNYETGRLKIPVFFLVDIQEEQKDAFVSLWTHTTGGYPICLPWCGEEF